VGFCAAGALRPGTRAAPLEPPDEEVLVDRPEVEPKITRVTGPFCVEATIPTPVDWEGDGVEDSGVGADQYGSFVDRMLEVLRKSPVLHVGAGRTVTLRNIRLPAQTLSLSAEAVMASFARLRVGWCLAGVKQQKSSVPDRVPKARRPWAVPA